jgi:hypothetical protein
VPASASLDVHSVSGVGEGDRRARRRPRRVGERQRDDRRHAEPGTCQERVRRRLAHRRRGRGRSVGRQRQRQHHRERG